MCIRDSLKTCGLTKLRQFATPFGNIEVDRATVDALKAEGNFALVNQEDEEEEHSLEMHLPYIFKAFEGTNYTLIPIMVGNLSASSEAAYGKLLAKYFDEPDTVFVVSSDFCHWGSRFQYTWHKQEDGPIHKSIEKLDKRGIDLIQAQDPSGFEAYLKETENTICGRHPIGVLLNIIANSKNRPNLSTKLVQYAQSEAVTSQRGSSVSYASLVTFLLS
eukprot:TRINITY_DN12948_c0_g1_i1.p1 TRINITY_DN12948_c0_g1~~TRINITY_DN12948_c0_g1_i1.p1  ORF type:complete len:237 (-),score=54.49 TRINITY_DN12948_c0_g1_i1:137-790(-)